MGAPAPQVAVPPPPPNVAAQASPLSKLSANAPMPGDLATAELQRVGTSLRKIKVFIEQNNPAAMVWLERALQALNILQGELTGQKSSQGPPVPPEGPSEIASPPEASAAPGAVAVPGA